MTRRLLKTHCIDGKLQLVLQPDDCIRQEIEALHVKNQKRKAKQKREAEGEEEMKIARRRIGYALEDKAEEKDKCEAIESSQELLSKLCKSHFLCVIGPPASIKTLTMFQVRKSTTIGNCRCNVVVFFFIHNLYTGNDVSRFTFLNSQSTCFC